MGPTNWGRRPWAVAAILGLLVLVSMDYTVGPMVVLGQLIGLGVTVLLVAAVLHYIGVAKNAVWARVTG